jgi:predicted metal-binding membrane protein
MLLLGLLMALEKNHPWGRHMSAPLGGALLAIAGVVVVQALS